MLDKVLQKKSLFWSGAIISILYALLGIVLYFFDVFWMVKWVWYLFGLAGAAWLLYLGRKQTAIRIDPAHLLLVLFMGWYVISCIAVGLVQKGDWVKLNTQYLADAAICTLFLFPFGCSWMRNRDRAPGLKWILHTALLGWTLFMAIVLVQMFRGQEILLPNGGLITTNKGNALELNCNQNLTGAWEMVFFLACLYMALRTGTKVLKAVYGVATGIHYMALVLAGSRTSYLASMFGFMAMIGIAVWLATQKRSAKQRRILTACVVILSGVAFYFLRGPLYHLFGEIAFPGKDVKAKDMLYKYGSLLSGREGLWKMSLQAMFRSPKQIIFGVTPASISDLLMQYGAELPTYTHNEILELILTTGFVGFGLCLAWLILILRDSWRMFFVRKEKTIFLCLPVIVLSLLLANMFEAMLLFYMRLAGYVFFFTAGCIHSLPRIGTK